MATNQSTMLTEVGCWCAIWKRRI